jgi:hypothetical protein
MTLNRNPPSAGFFCAIKKVTPSQAPPGAFFIPGDLMSEKPNESWHLSKSVPLSLIAALIIQAATVIWYGSQWTSEIRANRSDIDRVAGQQAKMMDDTREQAIQLARIEENTRNLADRVAELIRQLERSQKVGD